MSSTSRSVDLEVHEDMTSSSKAMRVWPLTNASSKVDGIF